MDYIRSAEYFCYVKPLYIIRPEVNIQSKSYYAGMICARVYVVSIANQVVLDEFNAYATNSNEMDVYKFKDESDDSASYSLLSNLTNELLQKIKNHAMYLLIERGYHNSFKSFFLNYSLVST